MESIYLHTPFHLERGIAIESLRDQHWSIQQKPVKDHSDWNIWKVITLTFGETWDNKSEVYRGK